MDLHKLPRITIDEARKAHVADERIQRQYGVKYLQFWVNEEAGNLFCLVEGPDKALIELNTAQHHHFGHIHMLSLDAVKAGDAVALTDVEKLIDGRKVAQ